MFKIKSLAIALVALMFGCMALGHCATSLKEELVLIDHFVKELRYEQTEQAQKLVKYLEKVLKNDCGRWGTPEFRYISDEEVLAVDRILTSGVSFEEKKAGVFNIMLEVFEKDAKGKEEQRKRDIRDKITAACAVTAYFAGFYLFIKYTPEINNFLLSLQKTPGLFRKAIATKE